MKQEDRRFLSAFDFGNLALTNGGRFDRLGVVGDCHPLVTSSPRRFSGDGERGGELFAEKHLGYPIFTVCAAVFLAGKGV